MSAVALMRRAITRARAAGVTVIETPDWETRGNGLAGYVAGGPIGNVDHHLVAQLRTDEEYIQRCVQLCIDGHATLDGPLCSVMTDPLGRLWVIAGLPANHAGRGSSAVRERVRAGQPPGRPGPDDYTGNGWYTGNEAQHPGDGTPWPGAMVNTMAVWDAALAVEAGWTENAAIQHQEHSLRKIDCSYATGPTPGATHRQRVAAWIKTMTGQTPAPTPTEEDEMDATQAQQLAETHAVIGQVRDLLMIPGQPYGYLAHAKNQLDDIAAHAKASNAWGSQNATRLAAVQAGQIFFPGAGYYAFPALAGVIREGDKEQTQVVDPVEFAKAVAPLISSNIKAISDADLQRIAKASADELAKRVSA